MSYFQSPKEEGLGGNMCPLHTLTPTPNYIFLDHILLHDSAGMVL